MDIRLLELGLFVLQLGIITIINHTKTKLIPMNLYILKHLK